MQEYHQLSTTLLPDKEIMIRALKFALSTVERYFDEQKKTVDNMHWDIIENEMKQEVGRITDVVNFLSQKDSGIMWLIDTNTYGNMYSVIKSALSIYVQDLQATKERTGSNAFDQSIESAKFELTRKEFNNVKSESFEKYWPAAIRDEGSKLEFFISYSTKDKQIAGRVAKAVSDLVVPFLAHDQVVVSDDWREEILRHLRSCSAIICIVTSNFLESEWTNQEAGFVMGRTRRVISLFFPETKLPGFLKQLQGKPTSETSIEADSRDAITQMLQSIRSAPLEKNQADDNPGR
jgi:hypothetical protein